MKLYTYWRSLATFRVRIALELKGLAYEPVYVDLDAGDQHGEAYRAVNPQMAIPALVEDDGNVLYQSLAILEYLDEVHPSPPLLPSDPRGRARVRALSLITVADSHPLIVPRVRNHLAATFGLDDAGRLAWVQHWFGAGLDAYEAHLSRDKATGAYCHGDSVTMAAIPRSAASSICACRTTASPALSPCASRVLRPRIEDTLCPGIRHRLFFGRASGRLGRIWAGNPRGTCRSGELFHFFSTLTPG
jgi:maleylacetoacetate isomerase